MDWVALAPYGATAAPIIITLFVAWGGWLSGKKTTINGWAGFASGMEMVALGVFPDAVSEGFVLGFTISTLMSNTILTKRA